jgi:subtilisin family serine protease
MKNRIFISIVSLVVVGLLFASLGLGGALAQDGPQPIYLKSGVLNPAASAETLDGNPGTQAAGAGRYFIVQFRGPVQEAWKTAAAEAGAELLDYLPDFAFKARMNAQTAAALRQMDSVARVLPFMAAYKLSPGLKRASEATLYRVRIERGSSLPANLNAIADTGAQVLGGANEMLLVAANSAQLDLLAQVEDVAWVENFVLYEKHNEISAGSIMGANAAYALGYDGSTQIVAVADTGLGGGTAATAHADIPASRIVAIYNWPGVSDSCWTITDDGSRDVDSGHGTHVALSVLGDGDPTGIGKGTAPGARLVFQSTENWATMKGLCALYYPNGYYLTGIPADVGQMFLQAYNAGARVHSNSWGSDASGDYTADSAYADSFLWSYRDMLVTFSAGNAGIDANSDGVIDNDSMGSPATAKNVLTVGASENQRSDGYPCDTSLGYTNCAAQGGVNSIFTWGSAWPADYPANPIKDDASAGNSQQMAAFSSRGPTDDGRIKPDVVAPGSWILSGYSDLYQQGYDASPNPQNNAWQYDGYGYPYSAGYKYLSGTSMSNPLTAGGAAVVKDFYQKAYGISASAALTKAALINSAVDMLDENNDGANDNDYPIPNNHEGWGLVNLAGATDGSAQFVNETTSLGTGGVYTMQFSVSNNSAPFKVTLAWTDYASTESASINLVNDLDLEVTSPSGTLYRGNVFSGGWSASGGSADRRNNVENVYVASPAAGTWTVTVRGYNIPQGPQSFALVADGAFGAAAPTNTPSPTNTPAPTSAPTSTPVPTATNTPAPAPVNTGYKNPSANAAVTSGSGDNNGYESSPANAYANDSAYASDNNSGTTTSSSYTDAGKDRHVYSGYAFGLPSGAAIQGIEVRLDAWADRTTGTPKIYAQLSWDGGATWTAAKVSANLTRSQATYILGSASDTWGRTWTTADFGSGFRLRIIDVATNTARDFNLDWAAVQVTYLP